MTVSSTHITSFPENNGHFQTPIIKGPEKQLLNGVQARPLYLQLVLWQTHQSYHDNTYRARGIIALPYQTKALTFMVYSLKTNYARSVGGNEGWMRRKCCACSIHKLSLFVLVAMKAGRGGNAVHSIFICLHSLCRWLAMKAEWGGNAVHSISISFHCLCWWQRKLAQDEDAVPAVCTYFSLTFALCVGVNVTVWTVIAQTSPVSYTHLTLPTSCCV